MSEEELKKEGYTYICLFCGNNNGEFRRWMLTNYYEFVSFGAMEEIEKNSFLFDEACNE